MLAQDTERQFRSGCFGLEEKENAHFIVKQPTAKALFIGWSCQKLGFKNKLQTLNSPKVFHVVTGVIWTLYVCVVSYRELQSLIGCQVSVISSINFLPGHLAVHFFTAKKLSNIFIFHFSDLNKRKSNLYVNWLLNCSLWISSPQQYVFTHLPQSFSPL